MLARRVLLYSALIVSVTAFVLVQREIARVSRTQAASTPAPVEELTVDRAPEKRPLSPDARFLDAAGQVVSLVTGSPAGPATCDFEAGRWVVHAGGRTLGELSELPRFAELHTLLADFARTLGAPESLAAADVDVLPGTADARRRGHAAIERSLAALHAVRAADLADRLWAAGHRDPATARLGARALAWMAAECFDVSGAGEGIGSRALAWSAVATAASGARDWNRTAVLLADVLGYPADACEGAAALGTTDPIRLYVLRRDEVLDAIASRGGSGDPAVREARWLSLRRAVQRRDLEAWGVAAARGLDGDPTLQLPLLASQLAVGRFESDLVAGSRLLIAVAADLGANDIATAPIAAIEDRPLAESMELFETLMDALPETADGVFLDRGILGGWYRASFYSSLMGIGEHLRVSLADPVATREFAASMGDGGRGPEPAAEFQRWYAHLVAATGNDDPKLQLQLRSDLTRMTRFGAGPLLRTWKTIRENARQSDPLLRPAASDLARRLDTRPEHLDALGWILLSDLADLARGEALLGASAEASHPRDLARRGWWAAYRGDRKTLDALLRDPGFRADERVALVRALRVMTPEDSLRLDAVSERLVGERPDDWEVLRPYVYSLAARHRNDRVRDIVGAWLGRPDRSARMFDDIDARACYAQACLEDGRWDEGHAAIRPVVGSWQARAMLLGAELLDRRGEPAAAETLAMRGWQRYPASEALQSLAVDLQWRRGRPEEAARLLRDAPVALSAEGWSDVLGPRLAAFERARPRDLPRIVDALVRAGFAGGEDLAGLAVALARAGRPERAADLIGRLGDPERFDPLSAIRTYGFVKAARGDSVAAAWLLAHLPADDHALALLLYHAYGRSYDEVLWLVPIPKGPSSTVESLWLIRACAWLRDGYGDAAQRAALRAHFEGASPDRSRRFGRMLLGLESADSMLAISSGPGARGEALYYLALRLQSEGRIREAAETYARCLDQHSWGNAEHHWAREQLRAWVARDRSIERLEAEARARSGSGNPATFPA